MVNFPLNSILKIEHFSDAGFVDLLRSVMAHWLPAYPNYPSGTETAKPWEIAQCVRAFRDHGVLRRDAEVLGVGAGAELTVFHLTNFVRRVFATDLYATNVDWKEADKGMLVEPARFAPPGFAWDPQRLVVQHMDALRLNYPDESFDGIFSCGSIEHFGSLENVAASMREMARVLRPGGVIALATEFRISGPEDGLGIPGTLLFTPAMVRQYIVEPSGLPTMDDPDSITTQATTDSAFPLIEAIERGVRHRSVALSHDAYVWTSGSVCLFKPPAR